MLCQHFNESNVYFGELASLSCYAYLWSRKVNAQVDRFFSVPFENWTQPRWDLNAAERKDGLSDFENKSS